LNFFKRDRMNEITQTELKSWIAENKEHQLIDVRERYEIAEYNIGGEPMPISELASHIEGIKTDIPVIIHCRSGVRSAQVLNHLKQQLGYENLINLKGGILGWDKA